MKIESKKIRTDFLKSIGANCECPEDFAFIEPLTDAQLLRAIVIKATKNKTSLKLLAIRYGVNYYSLRSIRESVKRYLT